MGHLSLGGAGGRRRHCGGGERDGRAAELHRPPRAREYAPGGWGGTAAARVGSSLGREQDEQGIRGQGRMRAPRLPAPGGGGSRAVTCGGSGGGGSRGGEGASFRKGWDLPARPLPPQRGPSPTYSGVPVAGLRVDRRALWSSLLPPPPPPPSPVPSPSPGAAAAGGRSNRLLPKPRWTRLPGAPHPTKGRTGSGILRLLVIYS